VASAEQSLTLAGPPDRAMQTCVASLVRAGFKNVVANQPARIVTAEKRAFGQWTKNQVTVLLHPGAEGQTKATVVSQASAQSLSALASNPAQRLVASAVRALEEPPR